ncbi:MAG: HEAT repeat domain-containing protein [Planctomycetota bacterium]|nr:HEAT repeat domain-containing protein [Planctomycetota bacterium]
MSWLGRLFGRATDQAGTWCDGIEPADVTGYEAAISLIPCAMQSGLRAVAFAERIDALISALPASRLSHLDQSIRDRSSWYGGWFSERHLGHVLPKHLPDHAELFLCLALCHPSGYVRQPAIREAAERLKRGTLSQHGALALQLLVLRVNDWVGPVANDASVALDHLLTDAAGDLWVEALPLIYRLPQSARRNHTRFILAVDTRAQSSEWAGPLMVGMRSGDRLVSRAAARCALANVTLQREEVVQLALDSADPVVRLLAARRGDDTADVAAREALLPRLDADVYMPVRREALRLRAMWFPDTLDRAHERLLLDRSRALRAQAQAAIRERDADPAEVYRARLGDSASTHVAVALSGLAEVGSARDVRLAEPYLQSPLARRRAAAIRCLSRLDGERHLDTFVEALVDPSPRVCRAAATALRRRVRLAGLDRVVAVLEDAPPKHVRRNVIRLLIDTDQWAPLGPLVRYAADGDEAEARWAHALLRGWFRRFRGWVGKPPELHIDAFRRALDECGERLERGVRRELEFLRRTLDG